ncbi:hypothetical protein H6F95_05420 [Cyanobacteria bacterium FACHB-471]|nr:hypothetical protein [Cyanobacteria bacterium FACHB-471]
MNQLLVINKKNTDTQKELTLAILGSLPVSVPLLVSGWLLVTIPDRYRAEVEFRSRAVIISGIVTGRKETTNCYGGGGFGISCTSSCNLKVRFTNSGEITEFWDSCYKSTTENQTVAVLYDPTNTHKPRIDRGDTPESLARDELILSTFLGLLGIVSLTCYLQTATHQKQT